MKKIISLFIHGGFLGFIIISALVVSYFFFIWSGFPKGGDAPQHLFRLRQVLEFFPNFTWFHSWAGGMPMFLWYPVLPYILLALLVKALGITPELALNLGVVGAITLSGVGVYLIVYELTKKKIPSFLAGFLYVFSPSAWLLIQAAVYARTLATPLVVFSIYFFVRFWKRWAEGQFDKTSYVLTVVILGLAILSHLAMGMTALAIVSFIALLSGGRGVRNLASGLLRVALPTFLLSTGFWLPLLFFKAPGFWTGKDVLSQAQPTGPWSNLVYFFDPNNGRWFEPNLFILPFYLTLLAGSLIVLGLIFRRKEFNLESFNLRVLVAFLVMFLVTVLYAQIYVPLLAPFYSAILPILWALFFSPIFLTVVIGLLWSWVFRGSITSFIFLVGVVLIVFVWLQTQFPIEQLPENPYLKVNLTWPTENPYKRLEQTRDGEFYYQVAESLIDNPHQFNYRLGSGNYGFFASWFNNRYPYVPQLREYFFPTVVVADYYFYMIQAGWNWTDNYPETNFLFDWWGIRRFIFGQEDVKAQIGGKFESKPEVYLPRGSFKYNGVHKTYNYYYNAFEFKDASPLLSATKVPAVLVIGDNKNAYNTIFRSLAYANLNSQRIIPVKGKELVEDYDLGELKKFPTIFLYEFNFKNKAKVDSLLKRYVEAGGRLIVEENKNLGQGASSFSVSPVESTARKDLVGWDLALTTGGQEVLGSVALDSFGAADFDAGPWGVVVAKKVKVDAKSLLETGGLPILVWTKVGQGEVIWSGINLPFHTVYYKNGTESDLMGRLLGLGKSQGQEQELPKEDKLTFETSTYKAEFRNPQERVVTIKNASSGVLFKEAYFPNWHAYLESRGKKQEVKIYKAGPDFMYVPVESSTQTVFWEYKHSLIENLALGTTVLTLVTLVIYFFEGKLFKPFIFRACQKSLLPVWRRATKWWKEEEE